MDNASRLTKKMEQHPSPPGMIPETVLTFKNGWEQSQVGEIFGGSQVTIKYAMDRLPYLRNEFNANWGIEAFVMFRPANTIRRGSVKDTSFSFTVPEGTHEVQVWFTNWAGPESKRHEVYDSKHSSNYRFPVKPGHRVIEGK